jgi:hypothetical protein
MQAFRLDINRAVRRMAGVAINHLRVLRASASYLRET